MVRTQMDDFALLGEMAAFVAGRAHALEQLVCGGAPVREAQSCPYGKADRNPMDSPSSAHAFPALRAALIASLRREFIPPIDRADLLAIADQLEEIVNALEDAEDSLAWQSAQAASVDMLALLRVLPNAADALQDTIADLRGLHRPQALEDSMRRVKDICAQGRSIYRRAMGSMSARTGNPGAAMRAIRGLDAMADANAQIMRLACLLERIVLRNT